MIYDPFLNWLNRRPLGLSIALGAISGLGLGAIAVFGIGGMLGCVLVLGVVVWAAKDAEPVLGEAEPEVTPVVAGAF